jgi:transposase-like protein
LSVKCDKRTAKLFICQALNAVCNNSTRAINVDKNAGYLPAIDELNAEETTGSKLRGGKKYLNNQVEQNYRLIKRLVNFSMRVGSFNTNRRTLQGMEVLTLSGLKPLRFC